LPPWLHAFTSWPIAVAITIPTPGSQGRQAHADDLYGLVQKLELAPAHLLTSSYGGDIVLLLALQHREVVRSLVLSEPGLAHWLLQVADGPELYASRARLWATFQPVAQRRDLEAAAQLYAQVALGARCFDALPAPTRQRVRDNAQMVRVPTLLLTGDHS
jgi:esterase